MNNDNQLSQPPTKDEITDALFDVDMSLPPENGIDFTDRELAAAADVSDGARLAWELSRDEWIRPNGNGCGNDMRNLGVYDLDYAIFRVRDAVDFAEKEGNFQPLRKWLYELEKTIESEYHE